MNYKIFISIIFLVLLGAGILLIQTKKESQAKVPFREGEELKIEEEKGKAPEVTLISVYDNYEVNPELKTAWGFGCVVKTSKELLLFDTGGESKILLFNMEKMGIDPKAISKVIISHIHGDHVGGLKGFLEKNNNVTVFIPGSFPDPIRGMIKNQGAEFISVDRSIKISDFILSTGELYGPPKEQSLIINSQKGLIVITGCAHPGVVNIVKKAKEMFPQEKVYLVLGGFHRPSIAVVKKFRELGVQKVAPSHCTGDPVREAFAEEYKEDFIEFGVGKKLML